MVNHPNRSKRPLSDTHRCYRGQRVAVIAQAQSGKFIVEGYGFVRAAVLGVDETYRVQFHDGVYERFVDPAAQLAPEEYVAKLNAPPAGGFRDAASHTTRR